MKSLKRIFRRSARQRPLAQPPILEKSVVRDHAEEQDRRLPIELLLRVFEFLSPPELIRCRSVSINISEIDEQQINAKHRFANGSRRSSTRRQGSNIGLSFTCLATWITTRVPTSAPLSGWTRSRRTLNFGRIPSFRGSPRMYLGHMVT